MLTPEEVEHIALLARIGLGREDVAAYQKDLSIVLDFFKTLKTVDTSTVEPIGHITDRKSSGREDRARDISPEEREAILKLVPMQKDGYVKVRSVF